MADWKGPRRRLLFTAVVFGSASLIFILLLTKSLSTPKPHLSCTVPDNSSNTCKSTCRQCLWEQPIVGAGATSGEKYRPTKVRNFDAAILNAVGNLAGNIPAVNPLNLKCPRWIVTTTINPPSPNLQAIANVTTWCKVIVLDKKSPRGFELSGPGLTVLSVADQEALPWRLAKLTPWNHFGRKNLGYLYALFHGAELIYDTDDDNIIEVSLEGEPLLPTSLNHGALHLAPQTADGAFNPYPFWGAEDAWPRGFPLSLINSITARIGVVKAPAAADDSSPSAQRTCLLQSLANTDPDVDGIFRLTHRIPVYFPPKNATLRYPAGVYAPANAQAALFTSDLAAALLLPVTVHGRVSDIWRSYILQRVMWDSGCRLAFADPWVRQYRNAHGYQRDFQAELDLYMKTEGLLSVLNGIKFSAAGLAPRIMQAYIVLFEYGLVGELDVQLAYAFLLDLGLLRPLDPPLGTSTGAAAAASSGDPGSTTGTDNAAAAQVDLASLTGSNANSDTDDGRGAVQAPAVRDPPQPYRRAAVCFTGIFRGGPYVLPMLTKNVLEPLGMPFDSYVVAPTPNSDLDYLIPNLKTTVLPDYSNITQLAALPDWKKTALTVGDRHNPIKWLAQLTDVASCVRAIGDSGVEYTHIVRLRADAILLDPIPVPPEAVPPGTIVVPSDESYGGVNDRFSYGRAADMTTFLSVIHGLPDLLARLPEDYKKVPHSALGVPGIPGYKGNPWNAEALTYKYTMGRGLGFDARRVMMCRYRSTKAGLLWMDDYDMERYDACEEFCERQPGCLPGTYGKV